jgi:hypothetical protein
VTHEEDKVHNCKKPPGCGEFPRDLETTLVFAMLGVLSLFKQF